MNHEFTAAVVQHDCRQDYYYNLEQSLAGIAKAAQQGADVVLLPELNCLPYFCVREEARNFDLAEPIPGPTTEKLATASSEHGIIIITSIFEKRAKGVYHNTAVVMDKDGSLAGTYRKMHIPDDPGFHEKYYFTPGDQGFTPIMTSIGKLGVLICWDQWFPEAARLMAL
ncbi:MAG TPA: nitrilase-related carbon-nitrogen hydrolase, partial [Gammaproteobacteria bacterium]|nr:nitrilase-related carbon-nitrogen hydrolase [Gammaproteobacteria bacterium]